LSLPWLVSLSSLARHSSHSLSPPSLITSSSLVPRLLSLSLSLSLSRSLDLSLTLGQPSTIGVEFSKLYYERTPGAAKITTQLWDTAGQERFRTISRAYFRGSDL